MLYQAASFVLAAVGNTQKTLIPALPDDVSPDSADSNSAESGLKLTSILIWNKPVFINEPFSL